MVACTLENAEIGPECSVGALAHIGQRVVLGRGCKIQSATSLMSACLVGCSSALLLCCSTTNFHHRTTEANGNQFRGRRSRYRRKRHGHARQFHRRGASSQPAQC